MGWQLFPMVEFAVFKEYSILTIKLHVCFVSLQKLLTVYSLTIRMKKDAFKIELFTTICFDVALSYRLMEEHNVNFFCIRGSHFSQPCSIWEMSRWNCWTSWWRRMMHLFKAMVSAIAVIATLTTEAKICLPMPNLSCLAIPTKFIVHIILL